MYTWPSLGVAPPPRHNASRKAWVSALDLAFHLISINTYFFHKKLRSGLSTQRVRRNKNRSINVYKNKRVRQNKNRSIRLQHPADLKCSDHNALRKAWLLALDLAFHFISINTHFFYKKLRSGLSTQRVRRNKNRSINVYKNKRVRQNKNRSIRLQHPADLKCSDHNALRKAWLLALDLAFHFISINTHFFYKKLRSGLSTQRVRRNKNRSINVYKNKRVRQNKNRSIRLQHPADLKCSDHNALRKAWLLALDLAFHFISINTHFFYKKLRSGLSTQRFLSCNYTMRFIGYDSIQTR